MQKVIIKPTAQMMKRFASAYSKEEWFKISHNQDFLDVFTEDLIMARVIAERIVKNLPTPSKSGEENLDEPVKVS